MAEDLHSLWLKIPPGPRPPDHYTLLGLPRFCADRALIESESQQRLEALDRYALHRDPAKRDACQQMMNEVARARVVLTDAQKRAAYDSTLKPAGDPTELIPLASITPPIGRTPLRQPAKREEFEETFTPPISPPNSEEPGEWTRTQLILFISPIAIAIAIGASVLFKKFSSENNPPENPAIAAATIPSTAPIAATKAVVNEVPPVPPVVPPKLAHDPRNDPRSKWVVYPGAVPVPSAQDLAATSKRIDAAFAADSAKAKSPAEKSELARKMVEMATTPDMAKVARYVLLSNALALATQAADVDNAMAAANALAVFKIDPLTLKARTVRDIANAMTPENETAAMAAHTELLITQAVALDRFDAATDACVAAVLASYNAHDRIWHARARARTQEVAAIAAEFEATAPARATQKVNPTDPGANLRIGRYRCWFKEEWTGGLPYLGLGGDRAASRLINANYNKSKTVEKILEIGDGWWNLAENLPPFQQVRVRSYAVTFYRTVFPDLNDPLRSVVENRISENESARGVFINLLPFIDLKTDVAGGTWNKQPASLALTTADSSILLRVPYCPPDECDFCFEFTGSGQRVSLEALLSHSGQLFGVELGRSFSSRNCVYSIDCVDGTLPNRSSIDGPVLEAGRAYSVAIKVRKDHVAIHLDGTRILNFATDYSDLKLLPDRADRPASFINQTLGLSIPHGPVTFTKIEVVEIKESGRLIRKEHN